MSRILLLGYTPPPLIPGLKVEAAHYRTWQFLQPLLADGHDICFCADDLPPNPVLDNPSGDLAGNLVLGRVPFQKVGWWRQLQRIHDSFRPDAVVAVNGRPALHATRLRTAAPIWMDLYGDPITIQQAACYRKGSDRGLPTALRFMHETLRCGDIFSACGEPQEHALAGQLGFAGRLNAKTFGYRFVHAIAPGAPPVTDPGSRSRLFLAQFGISENDFVVLWCGGYNTWTDVRTLFGGLETAIAANLRIHFVSVGASTFGDRNSTYAELVQLVNGSRYSDHFHLLGWRPWQEMSLFYREADIGINIDSYHYEMVYGTRTRLVEMMAYSLPVLTTLGCALSYQIERKGAGLAFRIGESAEMAQALLSASGSPGRISEMRAAAKDLAVGELSFEQTTRPVRDWARNPSHAPDKRDQRLSERMQASEYWLRSVVRLLAWRLVGADR